MTFINYAVFFIFAAVLVVSALLVVIGQNIVRAAVSLMVAFLAAAGVFIVLRAEFLAAVQILIYAGAIATLLIFALMLTRNSMSDVSNPDNPRRVIGIAVSVVLLALLAIVITTTVWPISTSPGPTSTVTAIGNALFNTYVLPFEIVGVLLLVALIGAILLARDPAAEETRDPKAGLDTIEQQD